MKIEDIRLGMSAITGTIYVYIPEKNNPENMLHKKDVTEDFRTIAIKQIEELKVKLKESEELLKHWDNNDLDLLNEGYQDYINKWKHSYTKTNSI